jgi:hypothetical protein
VKLPPITGGSRAASGLKFPVGHLVFDFQSDLVHFVNSQEMPLYPCATGVRQRKNRKPEASQVVC